MMIERSKKRPLAVTILAWVYIAVGVAGFAFHFTGFLRHPLDSDVFWAEITECLAIVAGIFMLRGHNWARWLALVWIAFHVILSAFHAFRELAVHALFFAVIAWLLFRRPAALFFRRGTLA